MDEKEKLSQFLQNNASQTEFYINVLEPIVREIGPKEIICSHDSELRILFRRFQKSFPANADQSILSMIRTQLSVETPYDLYHTMGFVDEDFQLSENACKAMRWMAFIVANSSNA